ITTAMAAEAAAVLNRTLSEVGSTASGVSLVLTSNTMGGESSLAIESPAASLVSLDPAPHGRLCVIATNDPLRRLRLFYAASDPLDAARTRLAEMALQGVPYPVGIVPGTREPTNVSTQARTVKDRQQPFATILDAPVGPGLVTSIVLRL